MTEFELVKLPGRGRHGQRGYYALADLPQRPSISEHALSTGWWELDQILKLYEGQFIVVTGVAGAGKSTFVQNLIVNLAKREEPLRSFLYVPENEQSVLQKFKLIWGEDTGLNTFAEFINHHCYVQSSLVENYNEPPHTLPWVLDQAVIAVQRDGVGLVVIDPWNEIERAKERDELLTDYIGWCLMLLKQFCRVHGVTMIMIAHPTKAGMADSRIPKLADIEGSMNWANKCDNGLIIAREEDKPTCRVISAKVREIGAGKVGVCWFYVDEATGKFTPQTGAVTP